VQILARDARAQLATRTCFELARRFGDCLREGWKDLLAVLRSIVLAQLLPADLRKLVDFAEADGMLDLASRAAKRSPARGSSSIFSALSSYFTAAEDAGTEMGEQNSEGARLRTLAMETVAACGLDAIFVDSRMLEHDALEALCATLMHFSLGPDDVAQAGSGAGYSYRENCAAFFLEMLANVVLWNKDRAVDLWGRVAEHLRRLTALGAAGAGQHQAFLAERAVVAELRLAARLIHRQQLGALVAESLGRLAQHASVVQSNHTQLEIALGVRDLVRTGAEDIDRVACWPAVARLLQISLRQHARALAAALQALSFLVVEAQLVSQRNSQGLVEVVLAAADTLVAKPELADEDIAEMAAGISHPKKKADGAVTAGPQMGHSPGQSSGISARIASPTAAAAAGGATANGGRCKPLGVVLVEVMQTLHGQVLSTQLGGVGAQSAVAQELWRTCWEPLLKGMSAMCLHPARSARQVAFEALQRSLLLPDLELIEPMQWALCLQHVLFPLLRRLLASHEEMDPDSLTELRCRACNLLSKVFLQHLAAIHSLEQFTGLWLKVGILGYRRETCALCSCANTVCQCCMSFDPPHFSFLHTGVGLSQPVYERWALRVAVRGCPRAAEKHAAGHVHCRRAQGEKPALVLRGCAFWHSRYFSGVLSCQSTFAPLFLFLIPPSLTHPYPPM
jgi:brefeldin A-resistance guanine nucleotide exchange factor 1